MQRRVLAALADNHADPMRDFEVAPWFQSWTPLTVLVGPVQSRYDPMIESTRRAVSKLAAAGVVETKMLRRVSWHGRRHGTASVPGARSRVIQCARRMRNGEYIDPPRSTVIWEYPDRDCGNEQLHARLALSPEDQGRYRQAEAHWYWGEYRGWRTLHKH